MKAAERVIAARGQEAARRKSRLRLQIVHQLVERIARLPRRLPGKAPEIGHRLEMDAANAGRERRGQGDQRAEVAVVHAADHRGDQRHADPLLRADADGLQLFLQQRRAAQRRMDLVARPVELEKDDVEPRLRQTPRIARVLRQAQPVGVDLHVAAPGLLRAAHQFRQIVPQRRFPAAELQQRESAARGDVADGRLQLGPGRVAASGAAVGEAVATAQIAAARDLQQDAAGSHLVLFAQPAAAGAAETGVRRQRRAPCAPRVEIHKSLPDRRAEISVLRAAFLQKDPAVCFPYKLRRKIAQADRTD